MRKEEIREVVRDRYGRIAAQWSSCCGPAEPCGCGSPQDTASKAIGYTEEELGAIPDGADLGLGCGNPTALASLKPGEVVLDLGAGAGIDCFLAANAVGETGRVIGVDMTSEMLEKARANARNGGFDNVEFRLGEIENLPVADGSVDVVISNCVVNLSPDKERVFKEAHRVLKSGGRVMVSDIALLRPLPEGIKSSVEAYVGCIAGATTKDDYLATVKGAGFRDVEVISERSTKGLLDGARVAEAAARFGISTAEVMEAADSVISMGVQAVKQG
jgi:SAM-dependent methyltransferase